MILADAVVANAAILKRTTLIQSILSQARTYPNAPEKTTVEDNLNLVISYKAFSLTEIIF